MWWFYDTRRISCWSCCGSQIFKREGETDRDQRNSEILENTWKGDTVRYKVEVGGKIYEVEVEEVGINEFKVTVNGKTAIFEMKSKTEIKEVKEERRPEIRFEKREEKKIEGKLIKAPMNGVVTKILIKIGDEIKEGDTIMTIEAMKMENPIKAPFNGKVLEIFVKVGDKVSKDSPLVKLG